MPTAYQAARVFDGTELLTAPGGMAVVVGDGRIDAVVPAAALDRADTVVVDLGDVTILPGLIDAHVHHGIAIDVARAISDGVIAGPLVLAAGHAIAMTGAGARCVKIMASSGVMDGHGEFGAPQLTEPESRAAPDPARGVREFDRTYREVVRDLARAGHPDYPRDQARILLEIGSRPGADVARLRAALDIDAGQLSRAMRDLRAAGTVEIGPCPTDRRRRLVTMTEAGRRVYEELRCAEDKAIEELLGRFTDAEQADLVTAMDVVRRLMNAALRQ